MKLKKTLTVIVTLGFLSLSNLSFASIVVVTNVNSQINHLSENQIKALFSGQANNTGLTAIDSPSNSLAFKDFYHLIFDWSVNEVTQYRSSMLFSGKGSPPNQANSTSAALNMVSHQPNLVTYTTTEVLNQTQGQFKILYGDDQTIPTNQVALAQNQPPKTKQKPQVSLIEHTSYAKVKKPVIAKPDRPKEKPHQLEPQTIAQPTQAKKANNNVVSMTPMQSDMKPQSQQQTLEEQVQKSQAINKKQPYTDKEMGLAAICAKGCTPEQIKAFLSHKNQVNLISG